MRQRLIASWGKPVWRLVHVGVMLAGLAFIVWGYSEARAQAIVVYQPPAALRYATIALMALAAPLFVSSFLPRRLRTWVRHPLFTAVMIWAAAHLLSNGALADLILFGGMLVGTAITYASTAHAPGAKLRAPSLWFDAVAVLGGLALFALFGRGDNQASRGSGLNRLLRGATSTKRRAARCLDRRARPA